MVARKRNRLKVTQRISWWRLKKEVRTSVEVETGSGWPDDYSSSDQGDRQGGVWCAIWTGGGRVIRRLSGSMG